MSHLRLRTLRVVRAVGGVVVYDQNVRPRALFSDVVFRPDRNGLCLMPMRFKLASNAHSPF